MEVRKIKGFRARYGSPIDSETAIFRRHKFAFRAPPPFCRDYPNTVSEWWSEYIDVGEAALHQQKRGRELGEGYTLSPAEEATVEAAIWGHFPEDYGIESALWTRKAVRALIEQLCGVKMSIRTVGEYLKRWVYSPQKPLQ